MTALQARSNPKPKKLAAKKPVEAGFACDYCKKSYQREQSFLVHMCEPKRRWLDQDTKYVKLGFMVYKRFYEANMIGKKEKTFRDFMESKFYTSFTHFGRHLLNINAVNPKGFVEFLIKTGVKLDRWESPLVYETYIRELNKKETPVAAIERNFLLMIQWSNDTGENWTDFFRKISPNLATQWIQSGRISPWILYTAASANELFKRLSNEQLMLIEQNINPDFWEVKLRRAKDDVDKIREELDRAGL
jgi:hypothetical protein